jgi:hypothetical protein
MDKEALPIQRWLSPRLVQMAGGMLLGASLFSCSSAPSVEQQSAMSSRYSDGQSMNQGDTNDPITKKEAAYQEKHQLLARELCDLLIKPGYETTPWEDVLALEDRNTALNKRYKHPDDDLMVEAGEYCPDTTDKFVHTQG